MGCLVPWNGKAFPACVWTGLHTSRVWFWPADAGGESSRRPALPPPAHPQTRRKRGRTTATTRRASTASRCACRPASRGRRPSRRGTRWRKAGTLAPSRPPLPWHARPSPPKPWTSRMPQLSRASPSNWCSSCDPTYRGAHMVRCSSRLLLSNSHAVLACPACMPGMHAARTEASCVVERTPSRHGMGRWEGVGCWLCGALGNGAGPALGGRGLLGTTYRAGQGRKGCSRQAGWALASLPGHFHSIADIAIH